jgi:hypothetical protein
MPSAFEIEMGSLPRRDTAQEHTERVQEMIDRQATPPPFPDHLPQRPPNRDFQRWILPGILLMLLLASMGANAGLGVFLGKEKSAVADLQLQLANNVAPTITSHAETTATVTMNRTSTVTPHPTCNPMQNLRLATFHCAMVNDCNNTINDILLFDCMNGKFCDMNPQCKLNSNSLQNGLTPQMAGCCGWCGCYDTHPGVIWLNNKVQHHKFGIIAETKTVSGLGVRAEPTSTSVAVVLEGTATDTPLVPLPEMELVSITLAAPQTSGATRRWRKWWSNSGVKYGLRKYWNRLARTR